MAVVDIRAGSEPTSGSVSRNAEMCVRASFGSHSCFCSSVPKSRSGSGSPIDWCAERSAPSAELHVPASETALT